MYGNFYNNYIVYSFIINMTKTDHTKTNVATATQNGNTIIIHKAGATSEQLTNQLEKSIKKNTQEIIGKHCKKWTIKIKG